MWLVFAIVFCFVGAAYCFARGFASLFGDDDESD